MKITWLMIFFMLGDHHRNLLLNHRRSLRQPKKIFYRFRNCKKKTSEKINLRKSVLLINYLTFTTPEEPRVAFGVSVSSTNFSVTKSLRISQAKSITTGEH